MALQQRFQRMVGVTRILYMALLASTVLIAVVGFVLQVPPNQPPIQPSMEIVLAVVGVGDAIASFVLPSVMMAQAAQRSQIEVFPAQPRPDGTMVSTFANPELAAFRALALGQTNFVLKMALSEVPSLLGLVMHVMGAPVMHTVPFFVVGTTLAALRFPTARSLVADFERAHRASFGPSLDGGTS